MTKDQAQLVKRSWRQLQGIDPEIFAKLFYAHLFMDRPALRRMFPSDMHEPYQMFMQMLDTLVFQAGDSEFLRRQMAALVAYHESYGVKPVHVASVTKALLWTLEKALGTDWNPEVAEAWEASCNTLSVLMTAARPGKVE